LNDLQNDVMNSRSLDAILLALFENYESIYDVNAATGAYHCYHESEVFQELQLESSGDDFFAAARKNAERAIYPPDRDYVNKMLSYDAMMDGLKNEKYYSFVYRVMLDGKPVYHKIRAVMDDIDGRPHFLIGVHNIDEAVRSDQAAHDKLASLYQKQKNHMEAILGTAASYLEANLTQDEVVEISPQVLTGLNDAAVAQLPKGERISYSELMQRRCKNYIVENAKKFAEVSSREHLIECFERGEKRASVYFSVKGKSRIKHPCREIFYLYRDDASQDVYSFCVVYDLTEQQQKEMEMEKLEEELRMSRIHNSTSQMQPHFLYNVLGSIQEIIIDDPDYAAKLLSDFTIHLRGCIRAMENDALIPFRRELENIRAYVNIEKMRFGQKLKIQYDIRTESFFILPLTIQPLVENAIRHGVYERGPAGGTVSVRSRETAAAWIVEVEDDGVGFDVPEFEKKIASGERDSTGLKNIMFRLDKVMHASVAIDSRVGEGTKVTVTIPKGEKQSAGDHC